MMSLKNYSNFVTEEINDFHKDLETSNKKIKFFAKFDKSDLKEVKTSFFISEPKKKFQAKIKGFKKITNNKGIF